MNGMKVLIKMSLQSLYWHHCLNKFSNSWPRLPSLWSVLKIYSSLGVILGAIFDTVYSFTLEKVWKASIGKCMTSLFERSNKPRRSSRMDSNFCALSCKCSFFILRANFTKVRVDINLIEIIFSIFNVSILMSMI